MAPCRGFPVRRPADRQSAFRAVPVEDFRQPAAQPRPRRPACSCCWAPGCSCPNSAAGARCWCWRSSRFPGLLVGTGPWVAQAGGFALGDASAGSRRLLAAGNSARSFSPGLSALRCLHQSGRDRKDAAAFAGDAQAPARMADLERFRRERPAPISWVSTPRCGSRRRSRWVMAVFLATWQPAHLSLACRSWGSGWPLPGSPGGSASRSIPEAGFDANSKGPSCDAPRARRGISSKPLSPSGRTGCRRTIFRKLPAPTIASRTSPTNMGLALLANLAARDFGYLSLGAIDPAHAGHARHDATTRAASRAFLQLV
jgi:hypothetical protein